MPVERVLEGEMIEHVGHETHARSGHGCGDSRSDKTQKATRMATNQFEIEVSRPDPKKLETGAKSVCNYTM